MRKPVFFAIAATLIFSVSVSALAAVYEANTTPWSGYWWPMRTGGLVTGQGYSLHPAPIEKYDFVTEGVLKGRATVYGLERYYDPLALAWEGQCGGWAIAAVLEPEPTHKGIIDNTVFKVGDKKGLLTALYDGALTNLYRFDTPVDFHYTIEQFIRIRKEPIIIDIGTGGEIWNYPVYKYQTNYTTTGNYRHYTTTIYYPINAVHPDVVGTLTTSKTYYYYFEVDTQGRVIDSQWEGSSISGPPVKALEPYGVSPLNPGLSYEQVQLIVQTNDDDFEENDSIDGAMGIDPGKYRLICGDDDYFSMDLEEGDILNFDLSVSGSGLLSWNIFGPDDEILVSTMDSESFHTTIENGGRYNLLVTPDDALEEPIYELALTLDLNLQYLFPLDPEGSWQSTIAIVSPEADAGIQNQSTLFNRVMMTQYDYDGTLVDGYSHTTETNGTMRGDLKQDFFLNYSENGHIRIAADTTISGFQVAASGEDIAIGAPLINSSDAKAELIIPHIARTGGWQTTFAILNVGGSEESVVWEAYDALGNSERTFSISIQSGQKFQHDAAFFPALTGTSKSIRAYTESGRNSLVGYVSYMTGTTGKQAKDVVPLPLKAADVLSVPHVADAMNWWTGVAVMNCGTTDMTAAATAYDESGQILETVEIALRPKQNYVRLFRNIFAISPVLIASARFSAPVEGQLCGFVLYGTRDGAQLAGAQLGDGATAYLLPMPKYDAAENCWRGIGMVNFDIDNEIHIALYGENRNIVAEQTVMLLPNQHMAFMLSSLAGSGAAQTTAFVKVSSNFSRNFSGIFLLGDTNNRKLTGGCFLPAGR